MERGSPLELRPLLLIGMCVCMWEGVFVFLKLGTLCYFIHKGPSRVTLPFLNPNCPEPQLPRFRQL